MRRTTILAAGAALLFATAASAQQEPAQPPAMAPAPAPEAPAAAPTIKSVTIVDIEQLPAETQTQVDALVAKTSEAELTALRGSIDSMPEIKSALEAKGLTSANVIAANMAGDGELTLVTKKAS
jgi:glucose/arabinose dehydrogenase